MPDTDIAPAPAPAAPTPDILKVPTSWRPPRGTRKAVFDAMFDAAESIMGLDPARGQKAHRGKIPNENMFLFLKDPADTLLFPHDHYLAGVPRYTWVKQPGGMVFGYLTDDAKAELAAEAAAATA